MKKQTLVFALATMAVLSTVQVALAQPAGGLSPDSSNIVTNIGVITDVDGGIVWILNLFAYFGWAGVIIGVGLAIFSLIYKLINSDSDQAMKTVQGYLTKAVLIVVAGILLIGASFIITTIRALFGGTTKVVTDTFSGVGL